MSIGRPAVRSQGAPEQQNACNFNATASGHLMMRGPGGYFFFVSLAGWAQSVSSKYQLPSGASGRMGSKESKSSNEYSQSAGIASRDRPISAAARSTASG